jgi:hypothetical protein
LGQVFSEYFGFSCQAIHRLLHNHRHHQGLVQEASSGLSSTPTQISLPFCFKGPLRVLRKPTVQLSFELRITEYKSQSRNLFSFYRNTLYRNSWLQTFSNTNIISICFFAMCVACPSFPVINRLLVIGRATD